MKNRIRFMVTMLVLTLPVISFSQSAYLQQKFCNNLNKVLESGRMENFESLDGMRSKQSPLLQVPGYAINMDAFPIVYVDKDNRFVAKTGLNMDSVSAIAKWNQLLPMVEHCLDSVQWAFWADSTSDNPQTVFFREEKYKRAMSNMFNLDLAIVRTNEKIWTVNLYIRRR